MTDTPQDEDPNLWLEDVTGERALAWVRERNAATEAELQADPRFEAARLAALEVLDSRDQIPYVTRRGDWLYNFWRDAEHPRGLWRRATLAEYRRAEPAWETVLDLDALAAAEGENWVWGGATVLGPAYRRALVQLSRGGADATVVREFDLVDRGFVAGGFTLPEAKTSVAWDDEDHLFVGTDTGPGALTASGYPRQIRRWARGTPVAEAPVVFEAEPQDVYAFASVDRTPGFERRFVGRATDFYNHRLWWLDGSALREVDKPSDASVSFWREHALIELRSDWVDGERTWPRGSLLVGRADDLLHGRRGWQPLFTPTARCSLSSFALTRDTVLLTLLDDVKSRLVAVALTADGWRETPVDAPSPGTLSAAALHDPELGATDPLAESYLVNYTDFLTPDSLLLGDTRRPGFETLKSRPAMFDAAGCRAEQRFATSADGTRVPYFVVWPEGATADGDNPTLLYGYGGFEVSRQPAYSATMLRNWVGHGGVYVLANLRGGGEYGPAWHQAALREKKQKSYDDMAAIAEALIAARVTRPERLALQGGSNGGLMVGAVMLQRPELFRAVVCQVPLLDMKRYHRLLAGASWMAEYGDPDLPEDWAFISRYSPYQRALALPAGTVLPRVLFTTSTRDDRVHPGHARKMAARLAQLGHPVWYWENLEGGHGGAADNAQRARMLAIENTFLWRQLGRR